MQRNSAKSISTACGQVSCTVHDALRRGTVVQTKWEENDEKPTTVALGLAGFVGLWAASGLLDSINRLPFVGTLFEAPLPFPSQTHTHTMCFFLPHILSRLAVIHL